MHTYVHPINMNMHTQMHTKEGKARKGKEGKRRRGEGKGGKGWFTGIYHKETKRRTYFAVFVDINKGMSKISGDRIL